MRKLFVLPMILAVFFADLGAFGAVARGTRGGANTNNAVSTNGAAPVAARAAVRGAKPASTATQSVKQNAPVSARAATRNAPKTAATAGVKSSTTGSVAARAGAKQKVINMGTKIASATANTTVDQECQDAFFGCMDSFCMLDNVSGGRCQCSDKNAEYETLLASIMEMDEQSQVLQTEGVSLLKMGKSADEVYAMAENAAKKLGVDSKKNKKQETTKSNTLDLSAWTSSMFDDVEEETSGEEVNIGVNLKDKKGDDLQRTVAKICAKQVPDKCTSALTVLSPMYTQKITSDCAAFGNSLKQQQTESNQKLFAAKQALRDTALEKYNEANRYDLGECVREYNSCMQKEDVCGDGFLGCVTFAAVDNMKSNTAGTVAKQKTIKGTYSSFTLSASTIEQLTAKRVMCDSILEQCVNVKNNVWDAFLKNAAPMIKVAESNAESDLRMNCVDTVSKCFQKACKEQMDPNDKDGSYDMCLSNPDMYKSLCKVQLEPCLLATGGSYEAPDKSSLWNALKARLDSMKVDACTQEVKDCLLSEDRCGKDYAGCIGLSTYQIGELCPAEKLTACMDQYGESNGTVTDREQTVREYVARIAQGLALNIDNSMLTQCQTALSQAMVKYCGDEESCPNAKINTGMFKGLVHTELCYEDTNENNKTDHKCLTDPNSFSDAEITSGKIKAVVMGKVDIAALSGGDNGDDIFNIDDTGYVERFDYDKTTLERVKESLNTAYKDMFNSIENDPKVYYCKYGREVPGFTATSAFNGFRVADGTGAVGRFKNLTDSVGTMIERNLLNSVSDAYYEELNNAGGEDMLAVIKQLSDKLKEKQEIAHAQELQNAVNEAACMSMGFCEQKPGKHKHRYNYWCNKMSYDSETAVCTMTRNKWNRSCFGGACDWHQVIKDEKKQWAMPKLSKDDMTVKSQTDVAESVFGGETAKDYH